MKQSLLEHLKSLPGFDDGAEADRRFAAEKQADSACRDWLARRGFGLTMRDGGLEFPTKNPQLNEVTEEHSFFKGYDHSLEQSRQGKGSPDPLDENHSRVRLNPPKGGDVDRGSPPPDANGRPWWWPKNLEL